ncbi:MAG: hypothetical protein UV95_C0002G0079 [Candidatus Falkowbacteria bacterium GW2011_GWF2_43_32]|nr:MAG: hypothetical protein UV95_C0002G0079 [Candidatus Falkowbacteria bacterium GW2011_GWF2_43_32]
MPRTIVKKKSVSRTTRPKKRTKAVLVDVIEDEPIKKTSLRTRADEMPWEKADRGPAPEELDQQKKFFSDLASEKKDKKNAAAPAASRTNHRLGLYRRFVWKFVIIVAILASIVAYFSFSRLVIVLDLKGETINDSLLLKVSGDEAVNDETILDPREAVGGIIKKIDAAAEKNYLSGGEEFVGEEIVGRVRIINNYTRNQPLVATTRLLSPDNKLFRIKNAVDVPAGGEEFVDIYVEKPTADLAIGPTTFTIPGLWLGLQDKIYAKSDVAFTFRQKVQKYVKPSDLERATQDINEVLLSLVREKSGAAFSKNDGWLYSVSKPATVAINAKAGEQKAEFQAKASGTMIAVSFSREQAARLATAKLNLLIPDDKELTEFKPENIVYSLESYDAETDTATLKASFTGTMILKSDVEIVNRRQLVNLTADQISNYLRSKPEVRDYELKFYPSFIRKAPSLVDRISIKIN